MDRIDGMRAFVAVAEDGSFTKAGLRLGLSTKLVSTYVRKLEDRLGAQLFRRTTRTVVLTEVGRAYLEHARPLLDQFAELEDTVQERRAELAGPIRLTAPNSFGAGPLTAALTGFLTAHPKIELDMQLNDRRVALIEDGFDLAVRFGTLEDSSLMARKLTDMRMVTVASPDYLARRGRPEHPRALATHDCILNAVLNAPTTRRYMVDGEEVTVRLSGRIRTTSPKAVVELAAAGLGIGVTGLYIAQPFVAAGRLEILFEDFEVPGVGLYAVYPPSRRLTARVRALIDWLAAAPEIAGAV